MALPSTSRAQGHLLLLFLLACLAGRAGHCQSLYLDLEYAKVGTHSLRLDLYLPAPSPVPAPLVVWLHGGGWTGGSKSEAQAGAPALVGRGFAVAGVDYRLSSVATYPAQLHDCKAAVRWLRARAGQYNLDPERFAALGPSAGGHLSAMLGVTGGVARLEGTVGSDLGVSSRVQAVVDFYGPTDFFQLDPAHQAAGSHQSLLIGHPIADIKANRLNPAYATWVDLVNDANPVRFVSANTPPFHIFHAQGDQTVIFSQSQLLDAALRNAGAQVTFRSIPGGGHMAPQAEIDAAWDFLADRFKPRAAFLARGGGCPGPGGGVPLLRVAPGGWPGLGSTFGVRVDDLGGGAALIMLGSDANTWLGVPLPVSLAGLGYQGCAIHLAPLLVQPMSMAGGAAAWNLALPQDPSLAGVAFRVQALIYSAAGPVPAIWMSNYGVGIIG